VLIVEAITSSTTSITSSTASGGLTSSDLFALTVSAIIGAVVGVGATVLTERYYRRPKITGWVNDIMEATLHLVSLDPKIKPVVKHLFLPFILMTNRADNKINIIDFELDVDYGEGFVKMDKFFGSAATNLPKPIVSALNTGGTLSIPDPNKFVLVRGQTAVGFGQLVYGFVPFVGDVALQSKKWQRIKVTCIDIFEERHELLRKVGDERNINLLADLVHGEIH